MTIQYEGHSACKECGKIADLISGLCMPCWNKEVAPNSRANLKLPLPDKPGLANSKYISARLNIPDFTDKLGRRWGMWSNGWIGVID